MEEFRAGFVLVIVFMIGRLRLRGSRAIRFAKPQAAQCVVTMADAHETALRCSVALCTYNGARFIRESLESLLALDYPDFELIISDNGSTDQTPEICQEFAKRDPRISYHRSPENRGAACPARHC